MNSAIKKKCNPTHKVSSTPKNDVPVPRENDTNEEQAAAVKVKRAELFIRPKVKFNGDTMNVTKTVKGYVYRLRKADSMIQLLLLDINNESQSEILEGEAKLPEDKKGMQPCVAKIVAKGRRLEFDMRISTFNLQAFKSRMFTWVKSTGSHTTISKDSKV